MSTLKINVDFDMIWPELPVQIVITGKPPDNSESESAGLIYINKSKPRALHLMTHHLNEYATWHVGS